MGKQGQSRSKAAGPMKAQEEPGNTGKYAAYQELPQEGEPAEAHLRPLNLATERTRGLLRTGKGQTGESAGTKSSRRTASKSMREVAALLLPPALAFPPPPRPSNAADAAALPVARGRAASATCRR